MRVFNFIQKYSFFQNVRNSHMVWTVTKLVVIVVKENSVIVLTEVA